MAGAVFIPVKTEYIRALSLLIMLGLLGSSRLKSQEIDYRSQSLFIYKFTKYIFWPEEKKTGDFLIGVYGNSAIFSELETMASLKKGGNDQNIKVIHITTEVKMDSLHLIYVASSRSRDINAISVEVETKPVLLVTERSGLAKKGATISFLVMDDGSLKFEVNVEALKRKRLRISEELLKLGYKI